MVSSKKVSVIVDFLVECSPRRQTTCEEEGGQFPSLLAMLRLFVDKGLRDR